LPIVTYPVMFSPNGSSNGNEIFISTSECDQKTTSAIKTKLYHARTWGYFLLSEWLHKRGIAGAHIVYEEKAVSSKSNLQSVVGWCLVCFLWMINI